jgi:hypothetical protein
MLRLLPLIKGNMMTKVTRREAIMFLLGSLSALGGVKTSTGTGSVSLENCSGVPFPTSAKDVQNYYSSLSMAELEAELRVLALVIEGRQSGNSPVAKKAREIFLANPPLVKL